MVSYVVPSQHAERSGWFWHWFFLKPSVVIGNSKRYLWSSSVPVCLAVAAHGKHTLLLSILRKLKTSLCVTIDFQDLGLLCFIQNVFLCRRGLCVWWDHGRNVPNKRTSPILTMSLYVFLLWLNAGNAKGDDSTLHRDFWTGHLAALWASRQCQCPNSQ